jgi:hypothetical protein
MGNTRTSVTENITQKEANSSLSIGQNEKLLMEYSTNSRMVAIGAIYQKICLPTRLFIGITSNGERQVC